MNTMNMLAAADVGPVLIFVLIAIVVIVAAIVGVAQERKRRQALAAWAAANGLSFSEGRDYDYDDRHADFRVLRSGDGGRYAYNIMAGQYNGRALTAFDYHYETHSKDSKGRRSTHHHHFSAIFVGSAVPLKPLHIRPEGFFDKIGAAFGFEDINFESAEFSRKFKVTSPDRRWAYDVLHARAIEYLLPRHPFSMQFGGQNEVMFWTSGRWQPGQFEAAATTVAGLLDMLPEYLKEQQRAIQAPGAS